MALRGLDRPTVSLPPLCNPIKGSTDIYPAAGLDACVCYAFFLFFLLKSVQIQIWGPLLFFYKVKIVANDAISIKTTQMWPFLLLVNTHKAVVGSYWLTFSTHRT